MGTKNVTIGKIFTKMKVNSYYISPRNQRRLEKKNKEKN